MKKYNYCFAVLAAIVLFLFGCAKDEGNYTYKDLSTSFVDTTAMKRAFLLNKMKPLSRMWLIRQKLREI